MPNQSIQTAMPTNNVTRTQLNAAIESLVPTSAIVDDATIEVNANKLRVKAIPTANVTGLDAALAALAHAVTAYAAGTVYTLTTSSAKVAFGTTSPAIVLDQAGTYIIRARGRVKYAAATITNQTAAFKLRRTNNTAVDISNAADTMALRVVTTETSDAGTFDMEVVYTTANNNDAIEMWGALSGATGAGSVQVVAASVVARRIA